MNEWEFSLQIVPYISSQAISSFWSVVFLCMCVWCCCNSIQWKMIVNCFVVSKNNNMKYEFPVHLFNLVPFAMLITHRHMFNTEETYGSKKNAFHLKFYHHTRFIWNSMHFVIQTIRFIFLLVVFMLNGIPIHMIIWNAKDMVVFHYMSQSNALEFCSEISMKKKWKKRKNVKIHQTFMWCMVWKKVTWLNKMSGKCWYIVT